MSKQSNNKNISIVRIALIQLYSALQHYYDHDYISAITLGGAAEEILGSIAEKRQGYNNFLVNKEYDKSVAHYFKAATPSDGKLKGLANKIRNQIKHNDSGLNVRVNVSGFKFVAEDHIIGALKNYLIIYKNPPRGALIKRFFEDMN